MSGSKIPRFILFALFFGVGTAALSGSILCGDLLNYYSSTAMLKTERRSMEQVEALVADYDALLEQIRNDPNCARRLAMATLGAEPNDPNTVYPDARAVELAAARKTLMKETDTTVNPSVPSWLKRCSMPAGRAALAGAGAALVLVSFVWFGPEKGQPAPGRQSN